MSPIEEIEGGVTVRILVAPGATRPRLGPRRGDRFKVAVAAPAERGAANAAVAEILASAVGVRARDVEVIAGHRGRDKTVRITGASARRVEEAFA